MSLTISIRGGDEYTRHKYETRIFGCAIESVTPKNSSYRDCIKKGKVTNGEHNDSYTFRMATYSTAEGSVISENTETTQTENIMLVKSDIQTLSLIDENHLVIKRQKKEESEVQARTTLECQYERIP